MKPLLLALVLTLPVFAQKVRIRQQPAQCQVFVRDGVSYCPLLPLAHELSAPVRLSGEGYLVGESRESVPAGQVQVNGKRLELQDEAGEPIVNAEEFCLALGGRVTHPERGVLGLYPKLASAGPVNRQDPSSFYFSQIRSSSNPTGAVGNGNCGPASLAMAARAFGRWPAEVPEGDYPSLMTWIRHAMGHKSDEMEGTNIPWLTKAATRLKLHSELFTNYDELARQIAKGRMVIVAGHLKNLNMPGGSHAMLVVAQSGEGYAVNDPGLFYKLPGTVLKDADLKRFFVMGVAVGEN